MKLIEKEKFINWKESNHACLPNKNKEEKKHRSCSNAWRDQNI